MTAKLLFTRSPTLERGWPFVPEALETRLKKLGELEVVQVERGAAIGEATDLSEVCAIALFAGKVTEACVAAAPKLKAIGSVWDNSGHHNLAVDRLFERGVTIVDATRAWAPSVAEITLGLALNGLRRIADWHRRIALGEKLWEYDYGQFCDPADFVNGTLGDKTVGVMGLGQIGGRVASWCAALGSRVVGYDPFISKSRFDELGVESVEMDRLVEVAEVVMMTIPPTPSAKHLLSRERIAKLRKGALVVVTTRTHAIDMEALRERILAGELAGAFDVYDVEPLPQDDPLRGLPHVVHTPHIAGRTRDANLLAAKVIADDFERILNGEPPQAALTREAIAVRDGTEESAAI